MLGLIIIGSRLLQSDTLQLSLHAASDLARLNNPALVAQRAEVRVAAQRPLEASRAFLPSVRLNANAMRTTDPVAVFGLKLRQENFQGPDLALDALNRPSTYSDFMAGGAVDVPVFVPEGLFEFSAARRGAEASGIGLQRAIETISFMVAQAYWNVQLVDMETITLESALEAANAHAQDAEAMQVQGLVTGLDARLARLRVAELESQLVSARVNASNARSALAVLLGVAEPETMILTDSLTQATPARCSGASNGCEVRDRADLVAARLGVEVAELTTRAALASNLPSIAAFGSIARHGQSSFLGNGSSDWTIGIGVTWAPFRALSGLGTVRRARAERDAAAARLEELVRRADTEVLIATRNLAATERRVRVAESAKDEAGVTMEQATLRYRTGIAPITELLDVQAATVAADRNLLVALRDFALAQAALDFAYGVTER
jgi:outer membrane protein TolC